MPTCCFRFGLGRVYQKMGKTRFAEYHFRRALEINPSNVVLYCCVGTVSIPSHVDAGTGTNQLSFALDYRKEGRYGKSVGAV